MASTGTLSLVNSQSARDPEVQVQARPVDSKFPSNCDPSFQNAQELARPTWTAVTLSHEASRSQQESHEASHPTIDTSHLDATDFNTSNHRHGLPSSRSSSSLASSFNTVIHLSSSTIANATPTPQVAQGSFLESRSDSSQLLTELAAKSTHENSSDSKPDDIDNANLADGKAAKIQFHNVVRISGGITSSPKRKRESKQVKQVPKKITIHRHRPPSIAEHTSSTSRSPTGRSSFGNGSPSYPHRMTSPNRASTPDSRSTLSGEIRRFDTRDSSSSPVSQSFQTNRQSTLRPGPPSARSSFSRRSRTESTSPSNANQQHAPVGSHPSLALSFARTASMSSSFTGSGTYSATIISRSSSPASSLYLPLRVPIVRAPAPFFGPTAERVARVRERRQVAQRDAERAKGGWKAWWNNWYYQSDSLTARKGKGKQDSTSATDENNDQGHSHYHSHSLDNSDSDDGSCYHDVILEHERKKLERKLRRIKQIRPSIDRKNARSESSTHQSKRKRPNPEKADSKASQSWLSWASSIIVGLPPSPAHPLLPPPPGSGILRRPRLTTTSILPGKPILPIVSDPTYLSNSDPRPTGYLNVPEVDSRTPLLARPPLVSSYGNLPPEPPSSSDPFQSSSSRIKTPTDARFGLAPRRWFTVRWWTWKVQTICRTCYVELKSRLVGLFHVDWDSDERRYEGWENV
ncbi:hypothetical protein PGT21_029171 [Puccinia graminis f. sp. tritici]|uniref:Uncharacterized protein n=1 Tax=Puccinia graminis f. sp. tritici TaxID=56615 RepID=A0A5B0SBT3_PUCGR|nr:hypothetical protein PGT21_029171 [Puccinia graminis f. sp. tritici]KAA1135267.1 hypothetical protein PGTUg99_023741 [Puccinia graminis f. sp. tritici]